MGAASRPEYLAQPVVQFDQGHQTAHESCASVWGSAEFLLWRFKSAPVNSPLITVNDNPATIAALNEPGTRIVFGAGSPESTNLDWFNGMRFTLGTWVDYDQVFGIEGSGFMTERRSLIYHNASAGGANPVVAIPVNSIVPFGINPAGETSQNSVGNPNRISAHLNAHLWGAEANGLVNLRRSGRAEVNALIGFRYLDLVENLSLSDTIELGAPGSFVYINDGFATRNQFYGGQIGARSAFTHGRWQLDAVAKIAFGTVHQVMNLTGESNVIVGGTPTFTTPQGTFVQSTNQGRYTRDVFAVVPEVTLNLGYQLTPGIRPFFGYNWMYLSNAVRPGNQIDRNINPTQNPVLVPPGTLTGPAAPLANFRSGDFWAQGFNLGLEIRY
jgi:hypothetical protein